MRAQTCVLRCKRNGKPRTDATIKLASGNQRRLRQGVVVIIQLTRVTVAHVSQIIKTVCHLPHPVRNVSYVTRLPNITSILQYITSFFGSVNKNPVIVVPIR